MGTPSLFSELSTPVPENEEWRLVPGYEGLYEASTEGRLRRGKFIKSGYVGNHGYRDVRLYRNGAEGRFLLHDVIMLTFVGPKPAGYEVDHKDRIRTNNRLSNLEYVTKRENLRRQYESGGVARGERNGHAKVSDSDVLVIREMYSKGELQRVIAARFGISRPHVSAIVNNVWRKK